jgi:hypothetical protein
MKTTVFKLGFPCGDTPEMTKPPEGGLSPQEHQAKPDGQGGSCIFMISDYLNNNNPKPEKPATKGGCSRSAFFSLAVYLRLIARNRSGFSVL